MNDVVMIAGGGIGGLSAALSFARQGFQVRVFEQAAEFTEVGAGLQLSPNPVRVLHSLGLEEALRGVACLPEATEFRNWKDGRLISSSPLGQAVVDTYGEPYYHIHRADLLGVLAEAASAEPLIELHAGMRVDAFRQDAHGVTVSTAQGEQQGGLLVGADGIHSQVRAGLFGEESPQFTGNVAWRALVPVQRLPEGLIRPVSGVWWGPHKHFVHYYVRRGELVNCVCVVEKAGWEVESWNERGDQAELARDFSGWHETVQTLIENIDPATCFKTALYDRPPMAAWSTGRVTLLGDACHPTLPFMAQGAAMAIEDSAVLARCVALGDDVPASLKRYESLRLTRTADIQNSSRQNASVFHMSGLKAWARNRVATYAGRARFKWLYSYNALKVVD